MYTMRTHRFAIISVALVASTTLISCGSDDNDAPADSGVPVVADSTIATAPLSTIGGATDSSVGNSVDTSQP
jgi:hypothetical protein